MEIRTIMAQVCFLEIFYRFKGARQFVYNQVVQKVARN
jgi:hypothetical protein